MKKLNILKVIDQFGWAYDFLDREQQRYSRHNIIIERLFDLDIEKINSFIDIIYFHSPNIHHEIESKVINKIDKDKVKIIGAYGGEVKLKYNFAHLVISISLPFVDKLKNIYPNAPIIFLPESVDNKFFSLNKSFSYDSFNVGFAGKIHIPLKRAYLLNQINYNIITQAEWGEKYFIKNRSHQPMKDFYNKIDVLLILSKTECMPRVALEAMSCGLPVVSTDVGCMKMLIGKNWIIPNTNDNEIVTEANNRLKLLYNYLSLRKEVGIRNKETIDNYFSWKKNSLLWDKIFESLHFNNYKEIKNLSKRFLNQLNNE